MSIFQTFLTSYGPNRLIKKIISGLIDTIMTSIILIASYSPTFLNENEI